MRILDAFLARARAHLRPGTADRGISDELQYHIDRLVARNVAAGMTPRDARAAALREFGNPGAAGDGMRDAARWAWLARVERDVRYAVRALRRTPGFALVVVGTIAVAIGLNAGVFTFFDAYVLRPLAVRDPSALHSVRVVGSRLNERFTDTWMDWDQYENLRRDSTVVRDALSYRGVSTRVDGAPAIGALVSGNYFTMLGVHTPLGRPIHPDDVTPGADGFVAVISHSFWTARFGADTAAVGRTLSLRGRAFTIIGVAGPEFAGLAEIPVDFWAPITTAEVVDGDKPAPAYPVWPRGAVVVRLQPGIPPEQARERIGRRLADYAATLPPDGDARIVGAELESRATVVPLSAETIALIAPVGVAFLLVLVIACANVANMMLARGLARQREIGIRMALGAGRRQVIGQLLAEAAVLAVPAAGLGYLISRITLDAGIRILMATFPPAFSAYVKVVPLDPDPRLFAFLFLLTAAATALFGLVPAVQVTRANVVAATRGEFGGAARSGRLRGALVVVQMAGCVLLMAVAAVLARGSTQLTRLDPGFDVSDLLYVELAAAVREPATAYLRSMPAVTGIEAASNVPARAIFSRTPVRLDGASELHEFYFNRVSPGYFDAVRIPLREGRTFSAAEAAGGEPVVILSETAARRLAPAGSAIGMPLRLAEDDVTLGYRRLQPFRTTRVIGVVADAAPGLVIVPRDAPTAYYPLNAQASTALMVSVRAADARAADLERDLNRLHPGAVIELTPLDQAVDAQLYPIRLSSWIAGLLGGIALLLTISGIYGVLAYLVAQRTREIGIRMSLGAQPRAVVGLVVRQSLRLAGAGAAIGIALAFIPSLLLRSDNLVVNTFDPVAYFGTAIVALAACLVAAWVPGRRAASVDPLEALRHD